MPTTTVTKTIAVGGDDYHANAEGTFSGGFSLVIVNTFDSTSTDLMAGFRFAGLSIPKGAKIDSAVFEAHLNEAPSNPSTVEVHLEAALNPAAATTATDHRGRALTTAKVEWPWTTSNGVGKYRPPDIKALVQEQVDKGDMTALIVRLRDKDRTNTSVNRRLRFRALENTSWPGDQATLTITYTTGSFTKGVAASGDDATANNSGGFSATQAGFNVGTSGSSVDGWSYARFTALAIPQKDYIKSAILRLTLIQTATGDLPIEALVEASLTPAAPDANFRSRAYSTVKSRVTVPGSLAAGGTFDIDVKDLLQEQVNKAGWSSTSNDVGLVIRMQDPTSTIERRLFAAWDHTAYVEPQLIVTHEAPPPGVSGSATFEMPAPSFTVTGDVTEVTTGAATFEMPAPEFIAEATVGTPPPRSAGAAFEMPEPSLFAYGGEADPTRHTPQAVERSCADSHHFVTEAGELLGFATSFDDTLGTPRGEMLGQGDDTWFPASNLGSREPSNLTFTARLDDRAQPRLERDRLEAALPTVRELVLPDGRILELARASHTGRPNASSLGVLALPRGANPRHPLLSGTVSAAFPTAESTPEVPIYAIDTAGGIRAPLRQNTAPRGVLFFALKANERGVLSLGSLGTPVAADGTSLPNSVTASYQDKTLAVSLWGVETRIREVELAVFGAVLVCYLAWTPYSAWLVVASSRGRRVYELPTGTPVPLSERILTAGVRSDGVGSGAFMVLGSHSLGVAYFSPRTPTRGEAERSAQALYDAVTGSEMTWAVPVPDAGLTLYRADSKALELAPGETLTTDFAVKRTNYTGPLDFSTSSSSGLTVTHAFLSAVGDTDTYRLTVTAPSTTPEGSQTFRVVVKAQGADNPGSLLVNVRDDFNAIVEVAASPAIMPNATAVRYAFDPISQRATEILKDSSVNGNTFSYAGYARPDRRYMGILATGKFGAAVFSGALANGAQAQRMGAEQTFCTVWGEVAKTPVGGVMYQVAADGSENGVHVLRAQGGFTLKTVNGATNVTSPDTLPYSSGNARLILLITATDIFLIDRDTGKSIRLARPAWTDAAVRTTVGALRSSAGAITSVTRAHLLADTIHPYALSPIQQRRNIDALTLYVPTADGMEWPDNAFGLFFWDDGAQKYLNHAAPALGITAVPVGTVDSIAGGVYPRGGGSIVEIVTGIPNTGVVTAFTAINAFKGSHTVAYEAQLSFADTSTSSATAQLARHDNGQPFAMICNTDFNHTYGSVNWSPVSGDSLFKVRFNPPAKALEVIAMANGATRTVKSNNSYPGNLVVTLGGVRRASGSVDRRTPTRNRGLVLCRGETTADDNVIVRELLAA